ncbi:hypothetical protein [Haloarchaeobius amylolyticus]|uniref:hypothetical protein n=1 Tax=Haloarchaeobius amylolyticus TaxID=1198296 RepID=UPI00226E3B81|nr:hypothetical protein [Haloarchaeobius amylolyticus]
MAERASRFAPKRFAVALVTVVLGAVLGMEYIPLVGTYVGTLLGAFVAGLAVDEKPTLEAGVAAVVAVFGVSLAATIIGEGIVAAIIALITVNPQTLGIAAALSFGAGSLGAHFGNDLRDGLTRPVDESGRLPDDR